MSEQEQIDRLIERSLDSKAKRINISDGADKRIRNKLVSHGTGSNTGGFKHKWKRAALVISCILLLASNILMITSYSAHAWAAEVAGGIIKKAQEVSGITVPEDIAASENTANKEKVIISRDPENGFDKIESIALIPGNTAEGQAGSIAGRQRDGADTPAGKKVRYGIAYDKKDTNLTIDEAEKAAGFSFELPEYLPEGYTISDNIWVGTDFISDDKGEPRETGNKTVNIQLSRRDDLFEGAGLLVTPDIIKASDGRISTGSITAGGKDVLYTETEISINMKNEPGNTTVIIEKYFYWTEHNLHYMLTDYTGLSLEELTKMIGSIK